MNRAMIFGVAIFFAVVGIALLGADNSAVAGHGCCGCHGGCGGCFGGHGCCGYQQACGCCGYQQQACGCCGQSACDSCGNGCNYGGGAPIDAPPAAGAPPAPAAPPAAPAPSALRRAPAGFRAVSFRR